MTVPEDVSSTLLRQRRTLDIFACMVALSLLLHLAASVIFVLPGRFSRSGAPPVYLELQSPPEAPAASAGPPQKEAADSQPATPVAEAAAEPATEAARLEQSVASSLQKAAQTPEAVHENSIGLGMLSGHFASFAEGASLKDDVRAYYFALMRRINEAWWTSGAAQGAFANAAAVNLIISSDGMVVACELLESSGSREQDKTLLAAVRAAEPLPPLPQSYPWPTFSAPIRFVPPLRLMFPGFAGSSRPGVKHGE